MKVIGDIVTAPLKAIGLIPSTPKLPAPLPQPTRDDAAAAVRMDDALKKRRGGAADIMFGASGAEAAPGTTGKTALGQ